MKDKFVLEEGNEVYVGSKDYGNSTNVGRIFYKIRDNLYKRVGYEMYLVEYMINHDLREGWLRKMTVPLKVGSKFTLASRKDFEISQEMIDDFNNEIEIK